MLCIYITTVNRKSIKLPIVWSSKVRKRYKSTSIIEDLLRSKRISLNFVDEDKQIKTKILQADYPLRFVDSIIRRRSIDNRCGRLVYYPNFFDEEKPFILIHTRFCEKTENLKVSSRNSIISQMRNTYFNKID